MTFIRTTLAGMAATVALAVTPSAWAMTAQQALQVIQNHGYVAPDDLESQYGYWTAKAVSQNGQRVRVLVGDADGSFTAIQKSDIGTKLPGAAQVADKLRGLGYSVIRDLELDDGLWEAKVRQNRTSESVEVVLHPVTLAVLSQVGASGGANVLPAANVVQLLQAAGYSRVRDLEFDEGRWEADAYNAAGQRVELTINAATGAVEREKLDD